MFEDKAKTSENLQNFDICGGPQYGTKNVPLIRGELKKALLDGLLIPHEDEWQKAE